MEQSEPLLKRIKKNFPFTAITFVLSYFVARGALEQELATGWRIFFALLPVPSFSWLLIDIIKGIRGMDELERRIHLEALAIAFPITLILLMTLGLLEIAIILPPEDLSYRHVWAFLPIFYFFGLFLARKRYA